jgi:hypothetical protein
MAVRNRSSRPSLSGSGVVMRKVSSKDCPYCGSSEVYRSEPKTLADHACVLFLVRLVRCHECMRRHYHPLFWQTPVFPIPAKKPVPTRANEDDKRKRSA